MVVVKHATLLEWSRIFLTNFYLLLFPEIQDKVNEKQSLWFYLFVTSLIFQWYFEIQKSPFQRKGYFKLDSEEKDQLIKAAQLLNNELDSINDKNNALIIAGLTLANKLLSNSNVESSDSEIDLSSIIEKIDLALDK